MSDQTGGREGADDPTGPFGARAPWARKDPSTDEARHSVLVGSMSVRVHDRIPVRRSTLVMVVAFLGFGVLLYLYPAQSTTTGPGTVVHTQNGDYFIPGATRVAPSTTTTTGPSTTTAPSTTTTTAGTQPIPPAPSTTTTARSGSTTSTPPSASTPTPSVGTTTTVAGPTGTSTSTTTGGQTTTTGP